MGSLPNGLASQSHSNSPDPAFSSDRTGHFLAVPVPSLSSGALLDSKHLPMPHHWLSSKQWVLLKSSQMISFVLSGRQSTLYRAPCDWPAVPSNLPFRVLSIHCWCWNLCSPDSPHLQPICTCVLSPQPTLSFLPLKIFLPAILYHLCVCSSPVRM